MLLTTFFCFAFATLVLDELDTLEDPSALGHTPTKAAHSPTKTPRDTSPKDVRAPSSVPQKATSFNFLVIGDWGSNRIGQKRLAKTMNTIAKQDSSSFVIGLGDNIYEFGVTNTKDPKFKTYWKNVYTDYLSTIPFYQTLGNHDWYLNPKAQIEYSRVDSKWIMPDFFYTHTETIGTTRVGFIYIDTDLFHYGYNCFHYECILAYANFLKLGWTRESRTLEKQYDWIESQLQRFKDYDYVFVSGHHQAAYCKPERYMPQLQQLFEKYNVSAYFFGHHHSLGYTKRKNTMFVLSGAAGKKEAPCAEPGDKMWKAGDTFGFVQVTVQSDKFRVAFVDEHAKVLYSQEGVPRIQ